MATTPAPSSTSGMPAELNEAGMPPEVERTSSRAASSTPPRSESLVNSRRVALEWCAVGSADNAASIVGMLLTILQCSKNFVPRLKCHRHFRICDIKEPEPAAPANPGMGGMGGMGGMY